jgi:hypothetical protein
MVLLTRKDWAAGARAPGTKSIDAYRGETALTRRATVRERDLCSQILLSG